MTARICSVEGCGRVHRRNNLCDTHDQRQKRLGTVSLTPATPTADRLWGQTKVAPNGCLEWTGFICNTGYGELSVNNRKTATHRLAWELTNGPIPAGMVVRHSCDNRPCINPEHLLIGTQADNIADAVERNRLNTTGLSLGRAAILPPRPCRDCGAIVTEGRKRVCVPCRVEIARRQAVVRSVAKRARARAKVIAA